MKYILILISLLGLAACDLDESSSEAGVTSASSPADTSRSADAVKIESLSDSGVAWKPVSDAYGTLVVILDTSFGRQSVTVLSANTKTILGSGSYVGQAGDGRLIYKFSSPGSAYPSPSILKIGDRYFNISDSGANTGITSSTLPEPEPEPSESSSQSSPDNIKVEPLSGSGVAWKPVSDTYGTLVVIINASFGRHSVSVLSADAKTVLDTGSFARLAGDGRLIYEFPSQGSAYPSPCILRVGNRYFDITDSSKVLRGT